LEKKMLKAQENIRAKKLAAGHRSVDFSPQQVRNAEEAQNGLGFFEDSMAAAG
jgi:hypothetical protein